MARLEENPVSVHHFKSNRRLRRTDGRFAATWSLVEES
jgi:hypothetical protein